MVVGSSSCQPQLCVQDDKAAVWRGPMVMSAIDTFINKVNWGALDVISSG